MMTRREFDRLPDQGRKLVYLYQNAGEDDGRIKVLFAMIEDLQKRLASLEDARPGTSE